MEEELVYKDLSYKIIGILFEVFNELGYGYQEKYYQLAIAKVLTKNNLKFKKELSLPIEFQKENIGRYCLDFLIEDKIVLEIKKGDKFRKGNIDQVYGYLKRFNLKLGILANFTRDGIKIKRIVNVK
jgi:GxxExxY protein